MCYLLCEILPYLSLISLLPLCGALSFLRLLIKYIYYNKFVLHQTSTYSKIEAMSFSSLC